MQITLQNTEKGQCYAVRFDRYRQQVVDKLKTAVSVRWWDKSTGAWMIPANNKCKAELAAHLLREALRTRQLGRERV